MKRLRGDTLIWIFPLVVGFLVSPDQAVAATDFASLPVPAIETVKKPIHLTFECSVQYDVANQPSKEPYYPDLPTLVRGDKIRATSSGTVDIEATYQLTRFKDPKAGGKILSESELLLSAQVTGFSFKAEVDSKSPLIPSQTVSSDDFEIGTVEIDRVTSVIRSVSGQTKKGARLRLVSSAAGNMSFFDPPGRERGDVLVASSKSIPGLCKISQ